MPNGKKMKVLVTSGATWVNLDKVRVITNIFTGTTGLNIARYFASKGAEVHLAYNPMMKHIPGDSVPFRLFPFVTYEDLKSLMEREISKRQYNVVIHSAAVSDYGDRVQQLVEIKIDKKVAHLLPPEAKVFLPAKDQPGKMKSNLEELVLLLTRTEKIVDSIKGWDRDTFLVKFKLEVGKSLKELYQIALLSMDASDADMMVANDLSYRSKTLPAAMIISKNTTFRTIERRAALPEALYAAVKKELGR